MIKKPDSKSELRAEIERQTRDYLQHGQQVKQIPKGVGGRDAASGPFKTPFRREQWQAGNASTERTYLTEVVDSLENRKQKKSAPAPAKRKKKPRKRLIYDDFGEPLRWVWVDE